MAVLMRNKLIVAVALVAIAAGAAFGILRRADAPQADFVALSGGNFSVADLRGKVVLVNFWATWCEPCREEMPSLERLRASMAGRPFAILAVNLAEPESRVRGFLNQVPLAFPVLLDPDRTAAKAWKARYLPATFIIGPDGRVRYSYFGELDWSRDSVRKTIAALLPQ